MNTTNFSVPVNVVPTEVAISSGTLTISGLTPGLRGRFRLLAPAGKTFAIFAPSGPQAPVVVEGVGSDEVSITIDADTAWSTQLSFNLDFGGGLDPQHVKVYDEYHDSGWLIPYEIELN